VFQIKKEVVMLYLIETINASGNCDFRTTRFASKELIANYLKNNPNLSSDKYVIIKGEVKHSKGRYIYDGRFQ